MNLLISRTILIFLFAIIFFNSCKEDKLDIYKGETNVYFSLQKWAESPGNNYYLNYPIGNKVYTESWIRIIAPIDSINKSYGFLEQGLKLIDTVYIPVSIMGELANNKRQLSYKLGVGTTATENVDFKVLSATIPANMNIGAIAIELYREKYAQTTKVINLELIPNNDFQTNFNEILRSKTDTLKVSTLDFRLTVSDHLTTPPYWASYAYYLGPFSVKKIFLLKEIANVEVEVFYSTTRQSLSLIQAWGSILKKYLLEKKRSGNTIYEEDAVTEMVAGPNV